MSDLGALADVVRAARRRKRWGQQELADAAGVSLGVVSNLERKVTHPQPANRRAIMLALDLDPDEGERRSGDDEDDSREWPRDVAVVLDVMGMYLLSVPEEQRTERIHQITRFVFNLAREQGAG